jgi:hypothetical protein
MLRFCKVWRVLLTRLEATSFSRVSLQKVTYEAKKGKVHPTIGHKGPEWEYKNSPTLSLTSTLDGGGWSMPCPGRFTLGKTLGTLCTGGWAGRVRKISPLPGFDPWTVQTAVSRYADYMNAKQKKLAFL